MTGAQLELASQPRPADALDCGVGRAPDGSWRVVWLRDGGLLRETTTPRFDGPRAACAASKWLRQQHGLDR